MKRHLLRRLFHRRLRGPFLHDEGHCWVACIPQWHYLADSPETPQHSDFMLYENGVPLREPHALHDDIRKHGGGLFSHWQDSLCFSSSDNSDPNTNGRRYSYTLSSELYRPHACLRDYFVSEAPYYHYWYRAKDFLSSLRRPKITAVTLQRYLQNRDFHPSAKHIAAVKRMSMLHEEVLLLLRYFTIGSRGAILEIGAYVGGATVILGSTARRYRKGPVISVEAGGHSSHPEIPSKDIFSDLKRNLESAGLLEHVCLLHGFSNVAEIRRTIEKAVRNIGIDLLIVDADGEVGRDVDLYSSVLNHHCVLVFDDYISPGAPEKAVLVKAWVDEAVAKGDVIPLGVFGWGTWIGLYNKRRNGDQQI